MAMSIILYLYILLHVGFVYQPEDKQLIIFNYLLNAKLFLKIHFEKKRISIITYETILPKNEVLKVNILFLFSTFQPY